MKIYNITNSKEIDNKENSKKITLNLNIMIKNIQSNLIKIKYLILKQENMNQRDIQNKIISRHILKKLNDKQKLIYIIKKNMENLQIKIEEMQTANNYKESMTKYKNKKIQMKMLD